MTGPRPSADELRRILTARPIKFAAGFSLEQLHAASQRLIPQSHVSQYQD